MKFILTIIFVSIFSVSFLYYLLTNSNFLPTIPTTGEVDWINFVVFIILASVLFFSLFSLFSYSYQKIFQKDLEGKEIIRKSLKISFILTIGLLIVFLLHVFHIISFFWGLGIFLLLLVLIFVI